MSTYYVLGSMLNDFFHVISFNPSQQLPRFGLVFTDEKASVTCPTKVTQLLSNGKTELQVHDCLTPNP